MRNQEMTRMKSVHDVFKFDYDKFTSKVPQRAFWSIFMDKHLGKVVPVSSESHPELFALMQQMNAREQKDIDKSNGKMISDLAKGLEDAKGLETKVKYLCNATGRIFDSQRQWSFANEKHVASIKTYITERWNELSKTEEQRELLRLRTSMGERPVANVQDKAVLALYWAYVEKMLPLDK